MQEALLAGVVFALLVGLCGLVASVRWIRDAYRIAKILRAGDAEWTENRRRREFNEMLLRQELAKDQYDCVTKERA